MDIHKGLGPLVNELIEGCQSARNEAKRAAPAPRFVVAMANIGWAQLFDYDMNHYYEDAAFQLEMQIRQRLFHWKNFDDDTPLSPRFDATVGMYADFALFDMPVRHERVGVPHIRDDHPMTREPNMRLLTPHDFYSSGQMPQLIRLWEDMCALAGDRLSVGFPQWRRGPLDIAIQLRGYENFIADTVERPQFVHDLMRYIVEERIRWSEERDRFVGSKPDTGGIGDDWINVPFISPAIFEDFCLPRYMDLEKYHGRISFFHSCGDKSPLVHLMLRIRTLNSYEVNHWTPLAAMLEKVPADKHLAYAFQNLDVLLGSEQEQEVRVRDVVAACSGRPYSLCGQSLQRISDDYAHDIKQTKQFIRVAKKVLSGVRG